MIRTLVLPLSFIAAIFVSAVRLSAHEYSETEVAIPCEIAEVSGTLTLPAHAKDAAKKSDAGDKKLTCVVLVGGTLSQTRDGAFTRAGAPPRDAMRRLTRALAAGGYASLRYDKVGFGKSKVKSGWTGTYTDEARLAEAAIGFARKLDGVRHVAAAGESAGAYLLCLAAKRGTQADAYLFLGGHCGPGAAIYEYNFARLLRLIETDKAWKELAEKEYRLELALGSSYREMFAAAGRGEKKFEIRYGDFKQTVDLARRKEELDLPPDELYQFIKSPALALGGEHDLNVPSDHPAKIVQALRKAGNHRCTCVTIAGSDHSFQLSATDEPTRLRERYNFQSLKREYSPKFYREVLAWLDDTLGDKAAKTDNSAAADKPEPLPTRAAERTERDAKTGSTPERMFLAPGIQIVEDVNFAPGTPTGYEVPFAADALILIFKGQRTTKKEQDFIDYLQV